MTGSVRITQGTPSSAQHSWSDAGAYEVRVKAKDMESSRKPIVRFSELSP